MKLAPISKGKPITQACAEGRPWCDQARPLGHVQRLGLVGLRSAGFALLLWLIFPQPAASDIVLSEIMFDPPGYDYHDEFVELYNTSDSVAVDLRGWTLSDGAEQDTILATDRGTVLAPGRFALVLDASYFDSSTSYGPLPSDALILTIDDGSFGKGGWSNSVSETVILIDEQGDTVAAYCYSPGNASGHSDEKILLYDADTPDNWADSLVEGGTPGRPNSVSPKQYDLALQADALVLVPERPQRGQTAEMVVTVRNVGTYPLELAQIAVYLDADSNGLLSTDTDRLVAAASTARIAPGGSYQTTLAWHNVPSGVHKLLAVVSHPLDQNPSNNQASQTIRVRSRFGDVAINEIMYAPDPGDPEWIELFNSTEAQVDLSEWNLNGRIISTDLLTLPLSGYLILAADSSAFLAAFPDVAAPVRSPEQGWGRLNNEGDTVVLRDPTDSTVDSVSYRGYWAEINGASLERIQPGLDGNVASSWSSCVLRSRGTPGEANSVFVQELPASTHLAVNPNPFDNQTTIAYQLPVTTATVNLWIYDRDGRRVRKLLNAAPSGSAHTSVWDGRDDNGTRLRMGIYIIYLEALNAAEGTVFQVKKPVVLARKL